MPGTYNGGGTVVGPGIPWPVEPPYEPPPPVGTISQEELLRALGITKKRMQLKERGSILKGLVAEGLLLDTGQPSPDHPKVVEIIKRRGPIVAR